MLNLFDDRLAPGFLIAPPSMGDPNFESAVVLLAAHDESGSMGFVLNRSSAYRLHSLLEELEISAYCEDQDVLIGGPVSTFSGFVLYEHEIRQPRYPGIEVTPTISVSASRELLEAGARGELSRWDLLMGYAGWGEGQLDEELRVGGWLHAPFDPDLLFGVPVEERYYEVFSRMGVAPELIMNVKGGAQA